MNARELKLWEALVIAERKLDDANPDVGMGSSLNALIEKAWKRSGLSLTAAQLEEIRLNTKVLVK